MEWVASTQKLEIHLVLRKCFIDGPVPQGTVQGASVDIHIVWQRLWHCGLLSSEVEITLSGQVDSVLVAVPLSLGMHLIVRNHSLDKYHHKRAMIRTQVLLGQGILHSCSDLRSRWHGQPVWSTEHDSAYRYDVITRGEGGEGTGASTNNCRKDCGKGKHSKGSSKSKGKEKHDDNKSETFSGEHGDGGKCRHE